MDFDKMLATAGPTAGACCGADERHRADLDAPGLVGGRAPGPTDPLESARR